LAQERVTFVWSAPNRLPLPETAVRNVVEAVRPYRFDRIYGGWWQPVLRTRASEVLRASADRYVQFLRGEVAIDAHRSRYPIQGPAAVLIRNSFER
jgi:hypothetical protein